MAIVIGASTATSAFSATIRLRCDSLEGNPPDIFVISVDLTKRAARTGSEGDGFVDNATGTLSNNPPFPKNCMIQETVDVTNKTILFGWKSIGTDGTCNGYTNSDYGRFYSIDRDTGVMFWKETYDLENELRQGRGRHYQCRKLTQEDRID